MEAKNKKVLDTFRSICDALNHGKACVVLWYYCRFNSGTWFTTYPPDRLRN